MFSKRRYSAPSVQPSDPQSGPRNTVTSQLPRYSNLSLSSSVAERETEEVISADALHDRMSFMSLKSNSTCPTYMTVVPEGHSNDARSSFSASTATITGPPRYSSLSHGYSAVAPREFEFALRSGGPGAKGQPWATLKLYNGEARGGKSGKYPQFCEGENIFGRVELSLLGPHTIKNIKLVLKGTIITSAMDTGSVGFLEQTYTIWDRSFGDPRQPQPEVKFNGKLEGDYDFPFSIPFPTHVKLSTLEAIQANGEPVQTQIQLLPESARSGGDITAFPVESPFQKVNHNQIASGDHVDSYPPGKLQLISRPPDYGQSHATPFHLGFPPFARAQLPARAEVEQAPSPISPFHVDSFSASSPTRVLVAGPSAITPYTYSGEDSSPSASKAASQKGRWSLLKSGSTATNGTQKKRRSSKVSSLEAKDSVFGGALLLDPQSGPTSPIFELPPKSEIPVVLPQSFLERDVQANTKYELTFIITHGGFSASSKVKTRITYSRVTIPPPMPWLRLDAYQERQPLPHPGVDSGVWHQLPTASITGTFLQQRELRVNYSLALANPLAYARGTVIPCYLAVACDDSSALNLFCNPRSPRVRLTRVLQYLGGNQEADILNPGTDVPSAGYRNVIVPQTSGQAFIGPHMSQAQQNIASNAKSGWKIQHHQKRAGTGDHRFGGGRTGLGVHAIGDLRPDTLDADGTPVSNAVWRLLPGLNDEGAAQQDGYRVELLTPVSNAFETDTPPPPRASSINKEAWDKAQKERVHASQIVQITTDPRSDEPDVIAFTKSPVALSESFIHIGVMFSKRPIASSVSQPSDTSQAGARESSLPQSTLSEPCIDSATRRNLRNPAPPQLPRYSSLSYLPSNTAEHETELEDLAGAIHERASFMSLESNITTPTYRTVAPAGHSNDMRSATRASNATLNPPRYSSMTHRYSAAAPREFDFPIRGGGSGANGQPWATLKLYNGGGTSGKGGKHPRFCEGENIFGRVELSLQGPHTIKNIKLVLKGTIITSALENGSVGFLEQTYTIWDRSFGDPRQPEPEAKFDGKLEGDYVLPFSVPFPKYVKLSTLEAVQANGKPVETQIQLPPESPGQITAFPIESLSHELFKGEHVESSAHPEQQVEGDLGQLPVTPFRLDSPPSHITPFHLGSPPTDRGKTGVRAEVDIGSSHITPFRLDLPPLPLSASSTEPEPSGIVPYTYSGEDRPKSTSKETSWKGFRWSLPKSSSGASAPGPAHTTEPGPSTSIPYTHDGEDSPKSTSKETSRKILGWSFSKSASTSGNDTQKKQHSRKASGSASKGDVFGGDMLVFPRFGPPLSLFDLPSNEISALKSDIPQVLPQSFLERDVNANTSYELTLLISQGRFSSSNKAKAKIAYYRATIPPPMPSLRRDAYEERRPLPCPVGEGSEVWYQLPTVSITGTFLQQRELSVDYSLALANPLSYARGTVIPCYLTIACDDISALNLFCNPRSPRVCLSRVLRYLGGAGETGNARDRFAPYTNTVPARELKRASASNVRTQQGSALHTRQRPQERLPQDRADTTLASDIRFDGMGRSGLLGLGLHAMERSQPDVPESDVKPVSNALWRLLPSSEEEGTVAKEGLRILQGEIHLPKDLQPSCPFALFDISYRVELLAPVSHAFEPDLAPLSGKGMDKGSIDAQQGRVYALQHVEITTGSRDDEPDVVSFIKGPDRSGPARAPPADVTGRMLSAHGFS